jgi:hypothetical protein
VVKLSTDEILGWAMRLSNENASGGQIGGSFQQPWITIEEVFVVLPEPFGIGAHAKRGMILR